ncbi:HNH endonuclease signature motif containing protein [Collinsella ihumii]|uniref:HNH endonuclease signature motif containing protein n=2 Tax=Collinsella ihumii TaxID=1720204 RepID=A0ABT7XGC8_9ACTN|nr:HNH endonuclease signature motif containing protein [Collinsella ihumii]MDN0055650.1 HNH endonuclease signature motif containing protein [Collinsella ihumii]MDN0064232.1 HNH endonuclease signature motif containing protein [Collinsella ihumii]
MPVAIRWRKRPDMVEWMTAFIPGHSEAEIRAGFKDRFGIELTRPQIKNFKAVRGVRSGTVGGRFQKGNAPSNKGRRIEDFMTPEAIERTRDTRFKAGQLPHNAARLPIGCERVTRDGYIEVKVAHRPSRTRQAHDNWVPKHRLVWERAHGRPQPKGTKIIFCDHDLRNFDPANLLLVTNAEAGVMNRMGQEWSDRETAEAVLALARLKMAASSVRKRPRACAVCGETFKPEFDRQRTCRACLDKGLRAPRTNGRKDD